MQNHVLKIEPALVKCECAFQHLRSKRHEILAAHFGNRFIRGLRAFPAAADFAGKNGGAIGVAPARRRRTQKIPRTKSWPRIKKLAADKLGFAGTDAGRV